MAGNLADQTLTLNQLVNISLANFPQAYISWMTFTNHSPYALQLNQGGNLYQIPAWYYYPVQIQGAAPQQISVLPYLQTIPGSGFTAVLSTNYYLQGEDPPSTVPMPLGGGPVDLTIASSIVNTNSPPATTLVFGEPVGDTSANGATNLNNQGQMTLGDSLYNGALTILGTVSTSQVNLLKDILTFFFNNKNVSFSGKYTLVNGDTSGNVQLFEVMQGSAKLSVILENTFVSGQKTIALISSYSTASLWMSGNIGLSGDGGYQVTNGGVTQNFDVFNAFNVAGGTTTNQANIFRFSFAHQKNGFDTLVIPTRTTSKVAATFIIGQ